MATQFPLFNIPDLQSVQQSEQDQGRQQDLAMAQVNPQVLPRFYNSQAARAIGDVGQSILGIESPAIKKAKAAQEVMKRTEASGIDFSTNPTGYIDEAIKHAMDLNQYDLAQQLVAQKVSLANSAMSNLKDQSEVNKNNAAAVKDAADSQTADYRAKSGRITALAYQVQARAQAAAAAGNTAKLNVSKVVGKYLQDYYDLLPKLHEALTNPAKKGDLPILQAQEKQLQKVIEMGQRQLGLQDQLMGYQPYAPPGLPATPDASAAGGTGSTDVGTFP